MTLQFFLIYLAGVTAAFIASVLYETYNKKDIWREYLICIYILISLLSYVILTVIIFCWAKELINARKERKKKEVDKKRKDMEILILRHKVINEVNLN